MIELTELREAAQKAFPRDGLAPPRDQSWQRVTEMGWLLVDLPEALGGLGLERAAGAAILYELGKVLAGSTLATSLLTLRGLATAPGLSDRDRWIGEICSGCHVPLNLLPATLVDDGQTLTGRISGLFDADLASHCLVGAAGAYRLVPVNAEGITLTERPVWDQSRRMFDLELDHVPAAGTVVLATGSDAAAMHDQLARSAHLFVAADSLGGATAALELVIDHLKLRRQFDRPLAMFQALKHRCADLATALAAAEALFWSSAANAEQAPLSSLGAMKALATDVYRHIAEDAIQLLGGIGLTSEHGMHLYLKRAMLNLQLCGSPDHWREAEGRAAVAATA